MIELLPMLEKLHLWLKYKLTGDDPRHWRLELHEAGFRCFARKRCDDVRWSDICLIRAYKRDIFTHDLVCIWIETKSGASVEIDEKMTGFGAVTRRIEKEFPTIPGDWFEKVSFPPLKANESTLWQSGGDDVQDASR